MRFIDDLSSFFAPNSVSRHAEAKSDTIFILAFSIIMLNTDLRLRFLAFGTDFGGTTRA